MFRPPVIVSAAASRLGSTASLNHGGSFVIRPPPNRHHGAVGDEAVDGDHHAGRADTAHAK